MSVVHNIQYIYIYVVCALNKGRRTEIMECVLFLCVYVLCVCVGGESGSLLILMSQVIDLMVRMK